MEVSGGAEGTGEWEGVGVVGARGNICRRCRECGNLDAHQMNRPPHC